MKNKFSIYNFKLFRYFKQLISNENPDNKSAVEKRKVVLENHLRWQDDGGPVVDTRPVNQALEKDPAKPKNDGTESVSP